jgi:hypothetical protein
MTESEWLAQAAYEIRLLPAGTLDSLRLAILADALEEAGCLDTALLDHLRGPGPHVRGCFALDAILARQEVRRDPLGAGGTRVGAGSPAGPT